MLILCTGNSCRSQMTEAFVRSLDPRLEVYSAGTNPAARVHPMAVKAMSEIGIDIATAKPKHVSQFLDQPFDYLITVCSEADENCPLFRGKVGKRAHIGFDDPAKATGPASRCSPCSAACATRSASDSPITTAARSSRRCNRAALYGSNGQMRVVE